MRPRRLIGTLSARVELISDIDLIHDARYFTTGYTESLLTDYGKITELSDTSPPDASLVIIEEDYPPCLNVCGNTALARGPFGKLERQMVDKRHTLLGNQGLLYRYFLFVLEKFHGIYSFHANALYDRRNHILNIVLGGAATGKSPALLAGVLKGLEVFGTELVHVQPVEGGFHFHRSSLIDNIRPQCIAEDFPELLDRLFVPNLDEFDAPSGKFPFDLSQFGVKEEVIRNPRLRFIVPRVEAGRDKPLIDPVKVPGPLTKLLFDNASEKIAGSYTLYNCLAAPGFDSPSLASQRFEAMRRIAVQGDVRGADIVLAKPRYFLEVF